MTPEEQFRQVMSTLNIPKVQLEAICDLHSAVYEAMDLKGIYDKLSNLDNYPRVKNALKVGAAAIAGVGPIGGVYNTINGVPDADDKVIEQQYETLPERDTSFVEPIPINTSTVQAVDNDDDDKQRDTVELNKGGKDMEGIRDSFSVKFPDASAASSPDIAMRKFIEANLSGNFKNRTTPKQQAAHIDRVLSAVKNTAKVTASRGIGEAELIALICVESMFNDKPQTSSYKGIAQLGTDAIKDARTHAGKFGLGSAPMRDAEIVEDAINMAASYLLRIMYTSDRSNKVIMVDGKEKDKKEFGDMRFVFACYNGGIGDFPNQFDHNKDVSIPQLYRKVLRGEMTPKQAVAVKGSMKEALTYPTKIFKVLDYLKSIGVHTNFGSDGYIYSKAKR